MSSTTPGLTKHHKQQSLTSPPPPTSGVLSLVTTADAAAAVTAAVAMAAHKSRGAGEGVDSSSWSSLRGLSVCVWVGGCFLFNKIAQTVDKHLQTYTKVN